MLISRPRPRLALLFGLLGWLVLCWAIAKGSPAHAQQWGTWRTPASPPGSGGASTAADVTVLDVAGLYLGTDVEAALAEVRTRPLFAAGQADVPLNSACTPGTDDQWYYVIDASPDATAAGAIVACSVTESQWRPLFAGWRHASTHLVGEPDAVIADQLETDCADGTLLVSETDVNADTGKSVGCLAPSYAAASHAHAAGDITSGTLGVAGGGTGATSLTAYAPVCGGTTSAGAVQSCGTGQSNSGYVWTSNGASALPSWQAAAGGVSDHGALTGLADDDHAQYGLLAGRSGGQILIGGTGSGDQLSLIGSSNSAGDSNSVNIFGDDDGSPRRRGVLRIYGSYTDADNYSRLSIYGTESSNVYVLNEGAGSYASPTYIRIANPAGGVGIWSDRFEVEKALQLDDPGTRPTCDSGHRGWVWYDAGGAGVADTVEICTKDAADAYAWRTAI